MKAKIIIFYYVALNRTKKLWNKIRKLILYGPLTISVSTFASVLSRVNKFSPPIFKNYFTSHSRWGMRRLGKTREARWGQRKKEQTDLAVHIYREIYHFNLYKFQNWCELARQIKKSRQCVFRLVCGRGRKITMKKLRNEENRNKKKEKRRKGIQGEGQQSI